MSYLVTGRKADIQKKKHGKSQVNHWETVCLTKGTAKVGWFQLLPHDSIELIVYLNFSKKASIIDVGGGDSLLVDWFLDQEYEYVTLLNISESALQKARNRLGPSASKGTWDVSDILEFEPKAKFDLWYDRAVFHFLTEPNEQQTYKSLVECAIASEGICW